MYGLFLSRNFSFKTLKLDWARKWGHKNVSYVTRDNINVNTNVVKDVIIYKYENPRFYKLLNMFSWSQFVFWTYVSYFSYTTLRDIPPVKSKEAAWWEKINLGSDKIRYTITGATFLIGYGILGLSWLYTLRSVRYLVLRKGGKNLTFVTYTPLGHNRLMTVGLDNVTCLDVRTSNRSHLPLKVKNRWFFYIMDMKGEFKNKALFDYTAGLKRTL